MTLDARNLYLILVFAAAFAGVQAITGLATTARVKHRVNERLKLADRTGGLQDLVVELRKRRGLTGSGDLKSRLAWLSHLITRSGLSYAPRTWALGVGGLFLAGAALGATRGVMGALVLAPLLGFGLPLALLKFAAARRARALGQQLPQGLEIIVRSLEAGHPVPTAIALVGREMADPIGSEFGMASDEIAYGATLEEAVGRMSQRCQHPDVDLFAATIRLQERAGGNLTGLLKLNAATVRERHRMRLKIKAASSEGRMSALILTAAPFIAAGAVILLAPDFYGEVIDEPFVRNGLIGMGLWMAMGNLVMRKMIDMRI